MRPPGLGSRPMRARAVTDLPDPDSPAMHSVSPLSIEKLRSCTTVTGPVGVAKATRRLSSLRRLMLVCAPRGPLVHNHAQEVEADHPIRHVHDLADPEIAADRAQHV